MLKGWYCTAHAGHRKWYDAFLFTHDALQPKKAQLFCLHKKLKVTPLQMRVRYVSPSSITSPEVSVALSAHRLSVAKYFSVILALHFTLSSLLQEMP